MEEIILLKLCMVKNNRYGNNCLLSVHVKKNKKKQFGSPTTAR